MNNRIINAAAAQIFRNNARPSHGEFSGDFRYVPSGVTEYKVCGGHAYIEVVMGTAYIVEILDTTHYNTFEMRARKIEVCMFGGHSQSEEMLDTQDLDELNNNLFFCRGLRNSVRELQKQAPRRPILGRAEPAPVRQGATVFELDLMPGSMRGTLRTENGARQIYLRRN